MYRPSSLLVRPRVFVSVDASLPYISTDSTAAVNTPTFVFLGMRDNYTGFSLWAMSHARSGTPGIKVLLTRAAPRTKVLV